MIRPLLALLLVAPRVAAQVTVQPIPLPPNYALPNFAANPLAPCPWPDTAGGLGPRANLGFMEGSFRLPSTPPFDSVPTWRAGAKSRWEATTDSLWFSFERGETYWFGSPLGAWYYLTGLLPNSPQDASIGCGDCLAIAHRCHEVQDGHDLYVAWGSYDGGWGKTDYAVLAALSLDYDQWVVFRGEGPSHLTVPRLLAVVKSLRL